MEKLGAEWSPDEFRTACGRNSPEIDENFLILTDASLRFDLAEISERNRSPISPEILRCLHHSANHVSILNDLFPEIRHLPSEIRNFGDILQNIKQNSAVNSGERPAAANFGERPAANSGENSAAANSGERPAAAAGLSVIGQFQLELSNLFDAMAKCGEPAFVFSGETNLQQFE